MASRVAHFRTCLLVTDRDYIVRVKVYEVSGLVQNVKQIPVSPLGFCTYKGVDRGEHSIFPAKLSHFLDLSFNKEGYFIKEDLSTDIYWFVDEKKRPVFCKIYLDYISANSFKVKVFSKCYWLRNPHQKKDAIYIPAHMLKAATLENGYFVAHSAQVRSGSVKMN